MLKIRKVSSVADRLHEIMTTRGLRQADLLNMAKPICESTGRTMTKSDISHYCLGKCLPAPDKLSALATALHVSESWLSGFDVEMEPTEYEQIVSELIDFEQRREKVNQGIRKRVGSNNLSILFWRASDSDREAIRQILKKYIDDSKYADSNDSGFLDFVNTGLFGLPETQDP